MLPYPPAGVTQLVECQHSKLNVASSILAFRSNAKVVKLVNTLVLGTSGLGRGGSTPALGTRWRDGRVVDCASLLRKWAERFRRFESYSLRKQKALHGGEVSRPPFGLLT